jgi:ferredoxin--NADP+ reductase
MTEPGTPENPLRVAIIGSGPSGFYAAERLFKQKDMTIEVDMFERLPTPYGLVRGGVAPDHQKIKSVTKIFDRIAARPEFRYYGNVEFGTNVTRDDLADHYHALIYAVGTASSRKLGIPGEDLPGYYGATEFVAWYNGHPDYRHLAFDLSRECAMVIGIGNVAMDVARILALTKNELAQTDIADYALNALAESNIKTIYIVGRRGPAQSKFTNPEIKELGELEDAEVVVRQDELVLDPFSQAYIDSGEDKVAINNLEYLAHYASMPSSGKSKRIVFRFLASPVEIIGDERVEAVKIVKNELYQDDRGAVRPRPTDEFETIPGCVVFSSVGYRGVALPGVPFHESWGVIPNEKGRVLTQFDGGKQCIGDYVTGWIKRGPSGVIGTNKPDSAETVESLLEDVRAGKLLEPSKPDRAAVESLLKKRGVRYVSFEEWQFLDQLEIKRGKAAGRPRRKFSDVDEMLQALEQYNLSTTGE